MDDLSSPDLCNSLCTGKIWCCGPVRTGKSQGFHRKKQLKQGDIQIGVRGDLIKVHEGE
jgi:hypothetical protein